MKEYFWFYGYVWVNQWKYININYIYVFVR